MRKKQPRQSRLDDDRESSYDDYDDGFFDYDLQVSIDTKKKTRFQLVGVKKDGKKEILKEFDEIPFSEMREFNAPESKNSGHPILKMGGAFVLGMLIGGIVVFLIMRSKGKETVLSAPAPAPFPMPEPIYMTPPHRADESDWVADYDKDIFVRGDNER